ncbi:MAG: hypothetical protein J5663_00780, partial [Bacteroidaceae bacterium]|nr:hypothetical protein [Bacteroidaceae bacterium]
NDNDKSFGKLSDPDLVASKDYVFPTSASVIEAFCYPHSISFVEPIRLTIETPDAEGMDLVLDYQGKGEETIAVTSDEEGLHANIPHFSSWALRMGFNIECVGKKIITSGELKGQAIKEDGDWIYLERYADFNAPKGFRTKTDNAFVNAFLKQWIGADTIGVFTHHFLLKCNFESKPKTWVYCYEQPVYTLKLTSGTKEFYVDVYGNPVPRTVKLECESHIIETTDLIYNPNFSLVRENCFCELIGWKVYDETVPNPRTGCLGATSATSSWFWTRFDNDFWSAESSVNLDGVKNWHSTAATFVFPEKPTMFCSSSSEYVYGDLVGYEMLLEPNQTYIFRTQLGYENEGEKGSVAFEFVNKNTGHKVLSSIIEPQICVTDTYRMPKIYEMRFKTDDASSKEPYKLVVKNANTNDHWNLVMSNLYLFKWYENSNVVEPVKLTESADTVKVDITTPNVESSENTTAPVVTEDKDGEKCYVYNPVDETKNQTVSFTVPVETVVAGNKCYVVIDLVPTDDTRIRATYYSFGLKGMPHKMLDRPSFPANEMTSVLGSYLYTGDKEERLVFEFTLPDDLDDVEIVISTQNPAETGSDCTSAIGLKQVSLTSDDETTAIEIVNNQKKVVPTEIHTMSGVKVSSLQKGINIVRFSDGSVKKVMY